VDTSKNRRSQIRGSVIGSGGVSEDAVAEAFARRHAHELRFCRDARVWYVWTGVTWRQDGGAAFKRCREAARNAARGEEQKTRIAVGKAAFATGVEKFAKTDTALQATAATWDSDPWLLSTPGGTVDLRTGILGAVDPEHFNTRSTAVTPSDTANCPTFRAFLEQATGGSQPLADYLQRWFGYALTGSIREHALLFVYGPGGSGKGTLLHVIDKIMGTYAATATMDTFVATQFEQHSTNLAMLNGARLVTTTETEEGRAWAEAKIKTMTGGDPVTARFMRCDNFTYDPVFKLTISGNHKPRLRNPDSAMRRRFNVVPFLHKPAKPDLGLDAKLRAEWPAILRWMIAGCLEWQRTGLAPPGVVTEATNEYFREQDALVHWLTDRCEIGSNFAETSTKLFDSWRQYAGCQGEDARTARWLADEMERRGFQPIKNTHGVRGRGRRGLRLLPPDQGAIRGTRTVVSPEAFA